MLNPFLKEIFFSKKFVKNVLENKHCKNTRIMGYPIFTKLPNPHVPIGMAS